MPDPGVRALESETTTRRDFLRGMPAPPPRADDYWIRVHRRAMACCFEITLESRDAAWVPAARDALNEIDRVESALSVFRDTSTIADLNRRAASEAVTLDEATFELLQQCADLARATGGAFDVTSTPLSRCWGFLQREGRLPQLSEIADARACVGFDGVLLASPSRSVRFARNGMSVNLGAIGKGHALDRVAIGMRAAGVPHALLSAGRSSLLAIGGRGAGWMVDVVSVQNGDAPIARLRLRNAALGTSGAGQQFVTIDGRTYGHVIDPRTGWPASGVSTVSVAAPTAAVADALSTAFLVGGVELAARYCETHDGVLALVTPEGQGTPLVFGRCPGVRLE